MKKYFCVIAQLAVLLGACAQQPKTQLGLVNSLQIGVQNNVGSLAESSLQVLLRGGEPNKLAHLELAQLQQNLELGNIDLALGFTASLQASQPQPQILALDTLRMHYWVLPQRSGLNRAEQRQQFYARSKALGFLSQGAGAKLTSAMVAALGDGFRFAACGNRQQCMAALCQGSVDAVASVKPQLFAGLQCVGSPPPVLAQFSEQAVFGAVLNPASLSVAEQRYLSELLTQQAANADLLATGMATGMATSIEVQQ